jgi:hypothetical protein
VITGTFGANFAKFVTLALPRDSDQLFLIGRAQPLPSAQETNFILTAGLNLDVAM